MKKLALLNPYPFTLINGSREKSTLVIIKLLRQLGIETEIISLSDKNTTSRALGCKQIEVKTISPNMVGLQGFRIVEFSVLAALGFRPTIEIISRSKQLMKALQQCNPDIIFAQDITFAKVIQRYKEVHSKSTVKVVALSDLFSADKDFETINYLATSKLSRFLINNLQGFVKPNYLRYQKNLYNLQIDMADAFILMDKSYAVETNKNFPNSRGKTYTIFPYYAERHAKYKIRPIRRIRKILFLGSCSHGPNIKAIYNIRTRIAPNMPDKEFIVSGKDCPECQNGNMVYTPPNMTLKKRLGNADLCISPLIEKNTGVKTKIFDYFSSGKVVLGTTSSFVGFNVINGVNAIIEDDIDKYPQTIIKLEKNKLLLHRIQRNVHTALVGHYKEDLINDWATMLKNIKAI